MKKIHMVKPEPIYPNMHVYKFAPPALEKRAEEKKPISLLRLIWMRIQNK